jgi:colanic acid/amylovoran biosynthesis glycosyltransferase
LANYGPEGVKFLSTCSNLGLPLVTHFHGFDAHASLVTDAYAAAYPKLGEDGNRVIAVSDTMKMQLQKFGVPEQSIFVIRYGVDPQKFPALDSFPEEPVFLAVGRFTDKKGPYLTLLAFKPAFPKPD